MKAFVIALEGHEYSQAMAGRCIETARRVGGIEVQGFCAIDQSHAQAVMNDHGLRWAWARDNTHPDVCPITGLKQHPYGVLSAKIGCSMSHFLLWRRCAELNEPILILEHDTVFIGALPEIDFQGICQINDPDGATPRGKWWSESMRLNGVSKKTVVFDDGRPDGLAGNSAYMIKPFAAKELTDKAYEIGLWPNDALMCRQLFPYLQEYFPFITRVDQAISTTSI